MKAYEGVDRELHAFISLDTISKTVISFMSWPLYSWYIVKRAKGEFYSQSECFRENCHMSVLGIVT
jgi:hypothetical protein